MDSRKSFVSSQRIQEVFDHPASSNASARPAAIGPSSRKVAIVSQLISRPKSAVSSSDLRTRLTASLVRKPLLGVLAGEREIVSPLG
jgi:hypothetical protein